MNPSKFSLADVLSILAALAFGSFCFLGLNFQSLGNVPKSIITASIITVLLFGTVFIAKQLKSTSKNFKTCLIAEVLLLLIFTSLLVFFTYMPFSHYFTVASKNTEIVSKIQTSITKAENAFATYESYAKNRKDIYKSKLESVVAAKKTNPSEYDNYGFKNEAPAGMQVNKKMENINANLFPTNYSDTLSQKGIKEVATNWLLDAKNTTANWKPIGITNIVVDIETKSNEWLSTLIEISKTREKGEEAVDFNYALTFDDIKQHFTTIEKPSFTCLLLALLMWVLMVLSWFTTKRHTKFPGFKLLFGKSQSSNNEL
jgi:hypothetical protein